MDPKKVDDMTVSIAYSSVLMRFMRKTRNEESLKVWL